MGCHAGQLAADHRSAGDPLPGCRLQVPAPDAGAVRHFHGPGYPGHPRGGAGESHPAGRQKVINHTAPAKSAGAVLYNVDRHP